MKKMFSGRRLRIALPIFGVMVLLGVAWAALEERTSASRNGETGVLEKMVVATGNVSLDFDLGKAGAIKTRPVSLRFTVSAESFFKTLAFNDPSSNR